MECARCGGYLVIEGWGGLIENIRERLLRTMRCVNCGSIDDSVILGNRLNERSAICCTTH
jgi:Zn finger protein HypA/HybF involved in hydrogenase expression